MAISMYQISVPVFLKTLGNLAAILDKGAAFAAAKKVEPSVLLGYRLAPDYWEFWQGRKSRLHDRLRYRPAVGGGHAWLRERLAP